MIDTVLTIVGDFSRFTLIKFFLRCKSERYIFYLSIFLVRNAKKKLNSINCEKLPTIVTTASILETILFLRRILKVVNLIFY